MSEVVIKNAGTGDVAAVNSQGYLKVTAVTEDLKDHACDSDIAQKFNINTGDITLTNASETSVLYIKNTSTAGDLVLTALIYNLGNTTGGSGDVKIDVIRNPTAGDIVTNANNVAVGTGVSANQNFGSANILSGSFFKGASGESVFTDGAVTISTRSASNTGRIVVSLGAVTIPAGSSLGVNYTPPSGNTSQIVQFAAACFLGTENVGEP
jgi:hypothetical protein